MLRVLPPLMVTMLVVAALVTATKSKMSSVSVFKILSVVVVLPERPR
jgi:hypothetical protein